MIRTIQLSDLHDALRRGWEDFKAVPSHAIILCVIYPVLGLVLARAVMGYSVLPLLFPLAAGFALIGPFAALGLYELSSRRERYEEASAWNAMEVLRSPSFGAMLGLGTLLLALFVTWVATAQAIYVAAFGYEGATGISDFMTRVLTTQQGWWLILVGCGTGLPVCACRALHQRRVVPLDARPPCRRVRGDGDVATRRRQEPGADGGLGPDRGGAAGARYDSGVPWPCRGDPPARPRHLAPLPQGDRLGARCTSGAAPTASPAQAGRRLPRQPLPLAQSDGRLTIS
ncbi:hypothetical protein ACVWZR_008464 [Bradyrhizobium sp. i1.3.1]